MLRTILIVLALTFFQFQQSNAAEYTLKELYDLALQQSERLNIMSIDIDLAENTKDKALSALMPRLLTYVSTTIYDEQKKSITGAILQPDSTTMWGAKIEQSFNLAGKELQAYGISKDSIQKAKYDYIVAQQDILFAVALAYFESLRAKKAIEIAHFNIQRLKKYRDAAALRLKVGEVTRTAVLRAEAELASSYTELAKAESALIVANAQIGRLTGINEPIVLVEAPLDNTTDKMMDDFEALKMKAFTNRAEIKALSVQQKIVEQQLKMSKTAHYPTLSIEGVYGKRKDSPNIATIVKDNLYGGIRLTLPIFEGGLRNAEIKEAEAKLRQIHLAESEIKKIILLDLQKAYAEYQTTLKILKSNEALLNFASDNYHSISRQYELGLSNTLDVVDANNLFTTAEKQYADSKYIFYMSLIKIKRAIGDDISKN